MTALIQPEQPTRTRISVDLSPSVSLLLDHISSITGESKAGIVSSALLSSLPDLVARADALKKRGNELGQAMQRGGKR